jgi:DNA-binding transcriptional LysR family regulator
VCRAFERRWPRATVRLVPAHQGELLDRLADGTIALALTYDLALTSDVGFEPLVAAPPYALVAADHPVAEAASVALPALAGEPFVLLDLPLSRDYFMELFRTAGVRPSVSRRAADPELVRSLVAWGYGYTLANARPTPTQAVDGTPLRAVPLAGPVRTPLVGLARRAGLRPTRTTTAFADACARVLVPGRRSP